MTLTRLRRTTLGYWRPRRAPVLALLLLSLLASGATAIIFHLANSTLDGEQLATNPYQADQPAPPPPSTLNTNSRPTEYHNDEPRVTPQTRGHHGPGTPPAAPDSAETPAQDTVAPEPSPSAPQQTHSPLLAPAEEEPEPSATPTPSPSCTEVPTVFCGMEANLENESN